MTHPIRQPGQSMADHKREIAEWMGHASVAEMDAVHDHVHRAICSLIGVTSHAMRQASGEPLEPWEQHLANLEENAALAVQRFFAQSGGRLPCL